MIRYSTKGRERALEKARWDYNGNGARVCDLLRGCIVTPSNSMAEVRVVCGYVQELEQKGVIKIVQIKNRHRRLSGYTDCHFNVSYEGHIAEIQVVTHDFDQLKQQQTPLYNMARSIGLVGPLQPAHAMVDSSTTAGIKDVGNGALLDVPTRALLFGLRGSAIILAPVYCMSHVWCMVAWGLLLPEQAFAVFGVETATSSMIYPDMGVDPSIMIKGVHAIVLVVPYQIVGYLAMRDMVMIEKWPVQFLLSAIAAIFYLWLVYHVAMSVGNQFTARSLLVGLPAYIYIAWLFLARYYVRKGNVGNRRSRVGVLYDKFLGIRGSYYVWKVMIVQTSHVVLQAQTKLPMFARIVTAGGPGGVSLTTGVLKFCHLLFLFALLVNVLYPPILLRTTSVKFQREVAAMVDVFLDCASIWPLIITNLLTFSPAVYEISTPVNPLAYMSSFWPVLHVFTCSRAVEKAVACRVREQQAATSKKAMKGLNVKATRLPMCAAVAYFLLTGGLVSFFAYDSLKEGLWPLAIECRSVIIGELGKAGVCGCSRDQKTMYTCRNADKTHAVHAFSFTGIGLMTLQAGALDGSAPRSHLANTPAILLNRNELSALELGVFDGLNSLRMLDLSNNSIASVAPGFFAAMPQLELLLLRGNPIGCSSVQSELPPGTVCNEKGYCDATMCLDGGKDCSFRPSWPGEEAEVATCAGGLKPLILQNTSHLVECAFLRGCVPLLACRTYCLPCAALSTVH